MVKDDVLLKELLEIIRKHEPSAEIRLFEQKNSYYIFVDKTMHDGWVSSLPKEILDEIHEFEYKYTVDVFMESSSQTMIGYTGLPSTQYDPAISYCIMSNANGFNDGNLPIRRKFVYNESAKNTIYDLEQKLKKVSDLLYDMERDNKHPLMEYYQIVSEMYDMVPMIKHLSKKSRLLFDEKSFQKLYSKTELDNLKVYINKILCGEDVHENTH